jgi:hypothetical protein
MLYISIFFKYSFLVGSFTRVDKKLLNKFNDRNKIYDYKFHFFIQYIYFLRKYFSNKNYGTELFFFFLKMRYNFFFVLDFLFLDFFFFLSKKFFFILYFFFSSNSIFNFFFLLRNKFLFKQKFFGLNNYKIIELSKNVSNIFSFSSNFFFYNFLKQNIIYSFFNPKFMIFLDFFCFFYFSIECHYIISIFYNMFVKNFFFFSRKLLVSFIVSYYGILRLLFRVSKNSLNLYFFFSELIYMDFFFFKFIFFKPSFLTKFPLNIKLGFLDINNSFKFFNMFFFFFNFILKKEDIKKKNIFNFFFFLYFFIFFLSGHAKVFYKKTPRFIVIKDIFLKAPSFFLAYDCCFYSIYCFFLRKIFNYFSNNLSSLCLFNFFSFLNFLFFFRSLFFENFFSFVLFFSFFFSKKFIFDFLFVFLLYEQVVNLGIINYFFYVSFSFAFIKLFFKGIFSKKNFSCVFSFPFFIFLNVLTCGFINKFFFFGFAFNSYVKSFFVNYNYNNFFFVNYNYNNFFFSSFFYNLNFLTFTNFFFYQSKFFKLFKFSFIFYLFFFFKRFFKRNFIRLKRLTLQKQFNAFVINKSNL